MRKNEVAAGRLRSTSSLRPARHEAQVELTHNLDPRPYIYGGRISIHYLAYGVENIYAACDERLQRHGVTINRPPRDGRMAFVRSPDGISIEAAGRRATRQPSPGSRWPTPGAE